MNRLLATLTYPPCSPFAMISGTAIADSSASGHYFMPTAPVLHHNTGAPPTTIHTATCAQHTSTPLALLALPTLPVTKACHGHIIPGFTNNLLGLGQLYDADCTAHLDKHGLVICNASGSTILKGTHETTGAHLWRVDITPSPNDTHQSNIIPLDDPPPSVHTITAPPNVQQPQPHG